MKNLRNAQFLLQGWEQPKAPAGKTKVKRVKNAGKIKKLDIAGTSEGV